VDELPELAYRMQTVDLDWPVPMAPEVLADQARRARAPRHLVIDSARREWVSEYTTHATHAFDLEGRHLAERVPARRDFRPHRPGDWLAVRGDGHLFVHGDSAAVEFDGDGQRVGRTEVESLTTWLFQPGSSRRWEVGGGEVTLFDGDGRVVARHTRGANRRWFRWLSAAAVAPGGELVVLDEPIAQDTRDETGPWIHVLDRTGRPAHAFLAPASRGFEELATDGERIALRAEHELVLLRIDGSLLGRITLPPATAAAESHRNQRRFVPRGWRVRSLPSPSRSVTSPPPTSQRRELPGWKSHMSSSSTPVRPTRRPSASNSTAAESPCTKRCPSPRTASQSPGRCGRKSLGAGTRSARWRPSRSKACVEWVVYSDTHARRAESITRCRGARARRAWSARTSGAIGTGQSRSTVRIR
jgi:hypothetical protein